MSVSVERFLDDLKACETVARLQETYKQSVGQLGFTKSAYVAIHRPGYDQVSSDTFSRQMVMHNTFPDEWRQAYRDGNFHRADPVFIESRKRVSPFVWDEIPQTGDLDAGQNAILCAAREFGLECGLTVPIHGPRGDLAVVSLASDVSEAEFRRLVQSYKHSLHILTIYYHETIQTMASAECGEPEIHLTERERECLAWTARGKSSWETSVLLNISERTVNFHIANVMKKLNVYNKAHAAAKGVTLGLTEL